MQEISVIRYPPSNDLRDSVEQRITGSIDHKKARIACTWLSYFFRFLEHYNKSDCYLTKDRRVVDRILGRYAVFLLSGFNITNIDILVGTICGYLEAVNLHYKDNDFDRPFDKDGNSDAACLL